MPIFVGMTGEDADARRRMNRAKQRITYACHVIYTCRLTYA